MTDGWIALSGHRRDQFNDPIPDVWSAWDIKARPSCTLERRQEMRPQRLERLQTGRISASRGNQNE
jgi:hypothetical protein